MKKLSFLLVTVIMLIAGACKKEAQDKEVKVVADAISGYEYNDGVAETVSTSEAESVPDPVKEKEDIATSQVDTKTQKKQEHKENIAESAVMTEVSTVKTEAKIEKTEQSVNSNSRQENPSSSVSVEEKPRFPGGDAGLYKWIGDHLVYPAVAEEEGISGRVVVQFVVEKDGRITNVKVIRSVHPVLDAEAKRVISNMPRWMPARKNGQPVRTNHSIPINFKQ